MLIYEAALVVCLYAGALAFWCVPALDTFVIGGVIVTVLFYAVLFSRPVRTAWARRLNPANRPPTARGSGHLG